MDAYKSSADDFDSFLNPFLNWDAAKMFQKPFREYAQKNVSKLIDWLEGSFDEKKIEELFSESDIDDQTILENLKLRFADIKNKLKKIEKDGYEFVTKERVKEKLKEVFDDSSSDTFVVKNIKYEYTNDLPIVGNQLRFYYNESGIGLRLTNYEFLINKKKSNKLVKVFLGTDHKGKDELGSKEFGFYHPYANYLFQEAVLEYCDGLTENGITELNFMDIIEVGYRAICETFGGCMHLWNMPRKTDCAWNELIQFLEENHKKYMESFSSDSENVELKMKKIIDEMDELGFIAFYPNPAYINNNSSYLGYSYGNLCKLNIIGKPDDDAFNKCDQYTSVFDKLDADNPKNGPLGVGLSDIRKSGRYVFRGDKRYRKSRGALSEDVR